jgi:hypothetical protein
MNCYKKWERESAPARARMQAYKEAAEKEESNNLLKEIIPNKIFKEIGVAYWNDVATTTGNVINRVMGYAIVGGILAQSVPSQHRVGMVAISDDELFLVDMGSVSGEKTTPKELLDAHASLASRLKVKSAPLKSLKASYSNNEGSCILTITGDLTFKATFPESYEIGNSRKAERIADAVKCRGTLNVMPEQMPLTLTPVCPNCRKSLPDGNAQFCIYCGKSLKS